MFGIDDLVLYTTGIGGALVSGEVAALIIKHKRNKPGKVGTSELGNIKKDLEGLLGSGIQVSKNIRLTEKAGYEGILIIGPTGSGKSTSEMASNMLQNDIPRCSIVVSDPKGELYKLCAGHLRSKGFTPMIFAPLSPENTISYNLLERCETAEEVAQLAECLLLNGDLSIKLQSGKSSNNGEWVAMSCPILTASMLYCWHKGYPINNVTQALKLIINNSIHDVWTLLDNCEFEDVREQFNIFKTSTGSERTAASILITLSSTLKLFLNSALNKATKKTDFDAKMLRTKPTALFISVPERFADMMAPFTAPLYSQLINKSMTTSQKTAYL